MGKFVIHETPSGFRFNLKAGNGEIIATSEIYKSEDACRNGIASVQKNAPVANLEDQTVANYETAKHPKFEVYTDKGGEFRFREGYKAKASCMNGIESIRKNAVDAQIVKEEK